MLSDLTSLQDGRLLEIEAVRGGLQTTDISFMANGDGNGNTDDDLPILGTPTDNIVEIEERRVGAPRFVQHCIDAFRQRGLTYPFVLSTTGYTLEILRGHEKLAESVAELAEIVHFGGTSATAFERRAFRALQAHVGGFGACVGAPRRRVRGPVPAVGRFRDAFEAWECGDEAPADQKTGDYGADGILVLGRAWGGPVVLFQSKNSVIDAKSYPEEFGRHGWVLRQWFGTQVDQHRSVVLVLATNSVLTLDQKQRLRADGLMKDVHLLDVTDILCAELVGAARLHGVAPYLEL